MRHLFHLRFVIFYLSVTCLRVRLLHTPLLVCSFSLF